MFNKFFCSRDSTVATGGKHLMYRVSPGVLLPRIFINDFPNRDCKAPLGYSTFMDRFPSLQICLDLFIFTSYLFPSLHRSSLLLNYQGNKIP